MYRLFVRHPVRDFERWRSERAAGAAERASSGVRAEGMHRSVEDPADVTFFHDFDTLEAAENFKNGPELAKSAEHSSGEIAPLVWITEQV